MIEIRRYEEKDKKEAMAIWNAVVREGIAFPQDEELTNYTANAFFMSQSYTGMAVNKETNEIVGLYIFHPNNVGRCGHICNTSYAVGFTQLGVIPQGFRMKDGHYEDIIPHYIKLV